MHIRDLQPDDATLKEQAAEALVLGFREHWPAAWPDMAAARAEVEQALSPEKVCRVACDDHGTLLGWIGGFHMYGVVWELHPLVVHPRVQGRGVGRALVADFEAQVAQRGGLTILLGSDDEHDMTSLSGVDLYPDVWQHIAQIRNLRGHPYTFYQTCGFVIVGVVPDANGPGKPDILLAKRVMGDGLAVMDHLCVFFLSFVVYILSCKRCGFA
ncbi:MAG: GNAT family N-acetyltransferase [Chloroflexaceae bacterium]|nr:GNAT family N-acetyltransferase [Chloroflexaceae bacterium]